MSNPERMSAELTEEITNTREKLKSDPITSEQAEEAVGEIGESSFNPSEIFMEEYQSLGENYTEVFGPGMTIEKWNKNAQEHAEKRNNLKEIMQGIEKNDAEQIKKGINLLNEKMDVFEEKLGPSVKNEDDLNIKAEEMKSIELSGERDFGYLKFHAKNQELDNLYQQLNKEKKLAEPNKFRIADLESSIKGVEFLRDQTEYGKVVSELRIIQSNIERINIERKKIDIYLKKLREKLK